MSDFPMQKITIYHKTDNGTYERQVKDASFRNTSMLNREKIGVNSSDKVLIRIFDVVGYDKNIHTKGSTAVLNCPLNYFLGKTWKVRLGDVIVNGIVFDEIESNTPITQLSNKYGKDNVFKVNSINLLIMNDSDFNELNHVKLGCI